LFAKAIAYGHQRLAEATSGGRYHMQLSRSRQRYGYVHSQRAAIAALSKARGQTQPGAAHERSTPSTAQPHMRRDKQQQHTVTSLDVKRCTSELHCVACCALTPACSPLALPSRYSVNVRAYNAKHQRRPKAYHLSTGPLDPTGPTNRNPRPKPKPA
jgi:hypothetical protein